MNDFFNTRREVDTTSPTEVFFSKISSPKLFKLGKYYTCIAEDITGEDYQDIYQLMNTIINDYNTNCKEIQMNDHMLMMWVFHEIARRWTNSMLDSFIFVENSWKIRPHVSEKFV